MPGAKPGAPSLLVFDVADHLRNEQEIAMYMAACREEAGDDVAFIASAMADCETARARWNVRTS
jgi:Predicted transcriptional regulator